MLSICIYSDQQEDVEVLRASIQDFLITVKMMAKVSVYSNPEEFITVPGSYDIYIMDMDSADDVIALGLRMRDIDTGSHFIYMSRDESKAYLATKVHADFFIKKPYEPNEMLSILLKIKKSIQFDNIIIQTSRGEHRIRVNHLNYVNIVKRCLCYHLINGNVFDGQTLRGSFEKAIHPLEEHEAFLFLPPSLLINIGEIKEVNNDNIVFENDDVLFYPKKAHETVLNRWKNYTRILTK